MASREWNRVGEAERDEIEALQDEAPIKLAAIARALSVTIRAATLPPGISGEIRPDQQNAGNFIIRVNRHDAPRRQRFTVAHEIGHFLLHRDQIGTGISDDVLYRSGLSDAREAEANRLAADILMPQALINETRERARALGLGSDDMVTYLADEFDVSEAAMRIRLGLA